MFHFFVMLGLFGAIAIFASKNSANPSTTPASDEPIQTQVTKPVKIRGGSPHRRKIKTQTNTIAKNQNKSQTSTTVAVANIPVPQPKPTISPRSTSEQDTIDEDQEIRQNVTLPRENFKGLHCRPETQGFGLMEALVCNMYYEASTQDHEGKKAVGYVVLNRMKYPTQRWGTTAKDILFYPNAFSWYPSMLSRHPNGLPAGSTLDAVVIAALEVYQEYQDGTAENRDNTEGATHYYSTILRNNPPTWAGSESVREIGQVGSPLAPERYYHLFFYEDPYGRSI